MVRINPSLKQKAKRKKAASSTGLGEALEGMGVSALRR